MSKTCILCGKDCSNLPRKKDAKGQYACQACLDARASGGAPAKTKTPASPPAQPANSFDAIFGDTSSTKGEPCPNCARARAKGAVLCTHCGFNSATGKTLKTSVDNTDAPTDFDGKRKKAAVDAATRPLAALIGGALGAAAGAVVWGILLYSMKGAEIPFSRIIVGVAAGFGAYKGAGGYAGSMSGGWAAACTIAAVLLARTAVAEERTEDLQREVKAELSKVTDIDVKREFADEVFLDMEAKGARIQFREVDTSDFIQFEQLPEPLESEVIRRWNAMGEAGQKAYARQVEELYEREAEAVASNVQASTKTVRFSRRGVNKYAGFALAVAAAFALGSGGSLFE